MRFITISSLLGIVLLSLYEASGGLLAVVVVRSSEAWVSMDPDYAPASEEDEFPASNMAVLESKAVNVNSRSTLETSPAESAKTGGVEYARDIRPLLARNCWSCHGPHEESREAELRLVTAEGLTVELPSGLRAVVPGDPDSSQLYQRIIASSPDQIMPPADSHQPLDGREIQLFKQWILEGAPFQSPSFQSHWAFEPLQPVSIPEQLLVRRSPSKSSSVGGTVFTSQVAGDNARSRQNNTAWAKNPIDLFVLEKLHEHELQPNPAAECARLIRRVSLDLTGLPPDVRTLQRLLSNWSDSSYSDYVDSLLASPAYGERMASLWLAAARYADTNGYQHDNGREMWPWRDWVVRAFNQNMPFDQFAVEQLAGAASIAQELGFLEQDATGIQGRIQSDQRLIREFYLLKNVPEYLKLRSQVSQIRSELSAEWNRRLTTMVMREMSEPRVTRRLIRGRYDGLAEPVAAKVPSVFPSLPEGQKADRLALAQWLVSPKHPLTARVAVNRQWQIFFGRGIVASSDDFGMQAVLPTHPKLLDWLANEFMASGWDVKRLHRMIVNSATYQQSSSVSLQAAQSDPENHKLRIEPIFEHPIAGVGLTQ